MRWYISYPVLAAGLAFGVDILFPGEPEVSRQVSPSLIETSSISEPTPTVVLASELEPLSRVAAFSPGTNLVVPQTAETSVLDYLAQAFSPVDARAASPDAAAVAPVTTWKSAVVYVEPAPAPSPAPQQAKPVPLSRLALARDIQRELKRVGCYAGEIDGKWGGGSKRALLMFMDRVNASLPTRDPDVFLLSLVRGQTASICGESCPQGQSLTASGRCLPTTLMAQAGKTGGALAPTIAPETVVTELQPPRPVPFGRMSIGGPKPADLAPLSTGWPRDAAPSVPAAPLERTAALDPVPLDVEMAPGERPSEAMPTSFDTDAVVEPPVRRAKAPSNRSRSASRAAPRLSSNRHVQRLFTHPLGM